MLAVKLVQAYWLCHGIQPLAEQQSSACGISELTRREQRGGMPPSERTRLLMTTFSCARLVTASAARLTRLAATPWHSVEAGMYLHTRLQLSGELREKAGGWVGPCQACLSMRELTGR